MLYQPSSKISSPSSYGLRNFEEVVLKNLDNNIYAWYSVADEGRPTILYFHGNGGNLAYRAEVFSMFVQRGIGVFAIDYRGYGKSTGKPSEEGLYQDMQIAADYLKSRGLSYEEDVVLYGESLGNALAIELATRHNFKAIILQAPFISAVKRAQEIFPILPVSLLMKDKFDNIGKIRNFNCPVAVIHGNKDKIIPLSHGRALYEKISVLNPSAKFFELEGIGHNDIPTATMLDALLWALEQG